MTAVIEIAGLRKTFRGLLDGRKIALDGFDMVVHAGQVHGFLGPNGSGKTTTLRALLGLVRADGGSMTILGTPSRRFADVAHRVGAIVESPTFFKNFSGRHTLRLLARAGGVPLENVEEALAMVGLVHRAEDPVGGYSLGMKQRLAVASALLKRPELLILDEPANGLDPAGLHEMRRLLRAVATDGVTVLISSHLLSEVEQICDSVTIISRGRRVAHGPVTEVLAGHDRGEYFIRAGALDLARTRLEAEGFNVRPVDGGLIASGVTDPAHISETLGREGIWLAELTPLGPDLETVYLDLTATRPRPGRLSEVDRVDEHASVPEPIEIEAAP
ncbi:MAG TPA: ATP-binding cassette domain-containing protein [Candidatus Limnocylindrales bacterium]|nr:ATP-binding cassette domain-containing protein [Candidatus Limnocylindrales bacterium]